MNQLWDNFCSNPDILKRYFPNTGFLMTCSQNTKTVYPDENNVVLNEKVLKERKPCINRESNTLEIKT